MTTSTLPIEASQVGVLTLVALPDTAYRLKKQLALQLERDEEGCFVLSEATTGAFHYDSDLSRAIAGFVSAFVEEFETLVQHEDSLSPAMRSTLVQFRALLEPAAK